MTGFPDPSSSRTGVMKPSNSRPRQQPDPGLRNIPPAVLELMPESVARENVVLPLSLVGETLTVATAEPDNIMLADKLSFILTRKIKFVHHFPTDIQTAIEYYYGDSDHDTIDSLLTEIDETETFHKTLGPSLPSRSRVAPRSVTGSVGELRAARSVWPQQAAVHSSLTHESQTHLSPLRSGMFLTTIPDGQRVMVTERSGRISIIVGPARILRWGRSIRPMLQFVAHPGEFLVIRFRDGRQQHLPGPCEIWQDPRLHLSIVKEDALQIAGQEAVVVYSRDDTAVSRRVIHGPTLFVPAPGEWLHTFRWHGSEGGSQGNEKVAKGLVFQKLWLMPDQMYHDVREVRTADDAVLTIKLMIFFELLDIERMLDETHDPIGDFVNATTSDVVDFTGRRSFEAFKKETSKLNELETYHQLTARAAQTGYQINKVVYRGYAAPARLQAMHDQAIEARTKLELDRATEEQTQSLEDYKLNAQMQRAAKRRTEQATEVNAELELQQRRQEVELEQRRKAAELQQEIRRQSDTRQREHLESLKNMGVDLTAYLTQGRADRVIELRGTSNGAHVHLEGQK